MRHDANKIVWVEENQVQVDRQPFRPPLSRWEKNYPEGNRQNRNILHVVVPGGWTALHVASGCGHLGVRGAGSQRDLCVIIGSGSQRCCLHCMVGHRKRLARLIFQWFPWGVLLMSGFQGQQPMHEFTTRQEWWNSYLLPEFGP